MVQRQGGRAAPFFLDERNLRTDMNHQDTITAIATPLGAGGIGIVRISGPQAEEIGLRLFRPSRPVDFLESHRLYFGDLTAGTGAVLDEVLVTLMRKPNSYTGEDVLEIHCHGGPAILQAILGETLKAGARPARPGEFTERAFLNGRLDLAQAESVMDLVLAKTDRALNQAVSQLKGRLSESISALRSNVLDLLASLEASIDFPEEETSIPGTELSVRIDGIAARIAEILSTYREGKLLRDGVDVVIAGKTNVGKSSLLNRLLGEERAIVTPLAGTTRDFIAEAISIHGLPVKLTDTAGIRDSEDSIELKGIEKVWERVGTADLVILVLDGAGGLDEQDRAVIAELEGCSMVVAVNKVDLPQRISEADISGLLPGVRVVKISAKYGDGTGDLKELLYQAALGSSEGRHEETVISNARHKAALETSRDLLLKARENIVGGLSPEFAACDLREAFGSLGDIIGETTTEDVLERIFSSFCIGK